MGFCEAALHPAAKWTEGKAQGESTGNRGQAAQPAFKRVPHGDSDAKVQAAVRGACPNTRVGLQFILAGDCYKTVEIGTTFRSPKPPVTNASNSLLLQCDAQLFDHHAVDFDLPPDQRCHFFRRTENGIGAGRFVGSAHLRLLEN